MNDEATQPILVTGKTKIKKIRNDQSESNESFIEQANTLQSHSTSTIPMNSTNAMNSTFPMNPMYPNFPMNSMNSMYPNFPMNSMYPTFTTNPTTNPAMNPTTNPTTNPTNAVNSMTPERARGLFEDRNNGYYWDDFVCEIDNIIINPDGSNLWSDLVFKMATVFALVDIDMMLLKRRNLSSDPRAEPKYEVHLLSKFPKNLGYRRWTLKNKTWQIVLLPLYRENQLDCPVGLYKNFMRYTKIEFKPGAKLLTEFNLFRGFRAREVENVDESKFDLILKHILEVFASNEKILYNYILDWLAFRVQKPGEKNGKTLLFQSKPGSGKNIFFEWFGESVIGKTHYQIINNISSITGNFNSVIEGCLFMIGDEISNVGKDGAMIKNILTQDTVLINHKGVRAYPCSNLFQMVFLTNNIKYFILERAQRRFVCFQASSIHRDNEDYFKRLKAQMNNEDCADHFYTWLLRRDITAFNDKAATFPLSEFHKVLMEINKTSIDLFIESYDWGDEIYVSKKDFYKYYMNFCNENDEEIIEKKYFNSEVVTQLQLVHLKGYPHYKRPEKEKPIEDTTE
jgi:hypothetical protein